MPMMKKPQRERRGFENASAANSPRDAQGVFWQLPVVMQVATSVQVAC